MDPLPTEQSLYIQVLGFLIALFATAAFSFLETCITALRLFNVKEISKKTTYYRSLLETLEKNPHRVLITVLIASSLANTTCAALITHIMEELFTRLNLSISLGFSLGVGIASASILIFGEIIPKNFAKTHGEKILPNTLWFINIVYYLLYPFVTLLIKLSSTFIYYMSGKTMQESADEAITSEKEVEFLIDYIDEKGLMESEKIGMLQSIFSLNETLVKEIMVPTTDIVSIGIDATLRDALETFSQYHFSRLPIYEDKHDNIIGMIYLKDVFLLLSKNEEKPLKDLVRPILYIPESVKVNQLLREFKQQHMHLAMVINEYGGIAGLVTLEDVLEEIVGEIIDEYEESPEKVIPLKQGGWLVNGSIDLEELSEVLNITFEAENAITLGGFLTEQLHHLPRKGERVLFKNYYFQIQHASSKRVYEVLIFEEKKVPEIEST